MSKRKSREIAIETMRRLAIGGAMHLSNSLVVKRLTNSSFAQGYKSLIETENNEIERLLRYEYLEQNARGFSKFFPTPFRKPGEFDIVLFRPHFHKNVDVSKIDMIQIGNVPNWTQASGMPRQYELGFRFEARAEADIHGYPHMQFTEEFDGIVCLKRIGASIEYPAVPIAEKRPHSRLFSALVSFAGLDCNLKLGLPRYLEGLPNTGGSTQEFNKFLHEARLTCKELSRAWNGKRGFNNGTVWGRFADRLILR